MKKLYCLGAVLVLLLICGMSYGSLQQAAPNRFSREVCYTADFDGMQVEVYPQRAAGQDYLVYDRFLIGLNGAYLTKDWTWNAGYLSEDGDTSEAPQIDYADINQDGQPELVFIFYDGINRGTSVLYEDVYVLSAEGKDYAVADQLLYLQDHCSSTVSLTETDIVINLSVEQEPYRITASKAEFGNPSIEDTGASVHYGDMVIYRVQDDRLTAEVPFFIFASATVGCYRLQYGEVDGAYQIVSATCEAYPDAAQFTMQE